ncbi:MAG: hypothetical protein LBP73_10705, partial [Clostridiales Family XIII bacterium]|nr:hypothetical protein [Clostridiales Family XIII bacterium]
MKRKTMLCVLLCAAPAVFAGAPGALAADGETAARADVAAAAVSYAVGSLHSGPSELGVRPVHTVSDDGYLYGCINEEGKLLTPPNSARDVLTQSGLILVHDGPLHENGGSRLVDADGNTVRAFDRSVVQYDGKRGVAVESANDAAGGLRYALTNENGVPLTEFAFEEMYLSANDTGADAILAKK